MRTYLGLLTNAVRSALRSKHDLLLENLALRQQLAVLTRQRARTRTKPADRLFWSWLSRYWLGWRSKPAAALSHPRAGSGRAQDRAAATAPQARPHAHRLAAGPGQLDRVSRALPARLLKRVGEAPRQLGLDLPIRDAGVDEGVRPAGEVGHQRVRVGVVDQDGRMSHSGELGATRYQPLHQVGVRHRHLSRPEGVLRPRRVAPLRCTQRVRRSGRQPAAPTG